VSLKRGRFRVATGLVITRSPAARERPHPCDAVLLSKRSKLSAPDLERLAKAVVGGLLSSWSRKADLK
jgi:hypothetical protein